MLMRADTVLFFNEKDRHNAVMAAKRGSMDSVREGIWPLNKSYDLDHKASLTVAAQLLSGKENQSIESVLNKPANILCFGTIRSGKGFKIAMEVAQKINDRKQKGELEEFTSTVIVAGDPQDTALVETLFKERFGASALEQYIQSYPYDFRDSDSDASEKKVDYWNIALGVLDALSCSITSETTLNNPYFDIVIRPDSNALSQLKDRCKYVIRLDDMGMRNNGSGIISVLNTGIVFAKWGMVTDKEYLKKGLYADAVILSEHKYGKSNKKINFPNCPDHPRNFKEFQLYNRATGFNAKKGIESSYKREEKFWDSGDILAYILSREQDQREHADNISQSKNYVTVFMAQILLATRFTLENSVLSLTRALASNTPKILTSGYELESPTLLSNSFFTSKTEDKGSASQSLPGKTNSFS